MLAAILQQFLALGITGLRWRWLIATVLSAGVLLRLPAAEPAVAEFHDVAWSPGDSAKTGATEMALLMCVAQLRQGHALAGLVCVGNRDGAFQVATEDILARVALMGVPIVKLAQRGAPPVNPDDVFIEAGVLPPGTAKNLLAECLARYGAPPAAADPGRPSARELTALRAKLALYQSVFDTANATQVALR